MRQNKIRSINKFFFLISFLFAALLIGCKSTSTSPSNENFSLSIQKSALGSNTIQSDTLTLDTVKISLKNVELISDSSSGYGEGEDSEEVKMGPFIVNLNLNGSLNTIALTNIKAGTYTGVKFEIHRLENDEVSLDSEFTDSTCGKQGYSIVVTGSYLGTAFVFKSRKSFHQHVLFSNPITVTDNGMINVTLTVDPYSWFIKDGNYINPADPTNFRIIDQQIRTSFQNGFIDNNRNGHPGHH